MRHVHRWAVTGRGWKSLVWDPVTLGAVCGLASSVIYTAANVCLRAVSHCDPVWVSCVKAFPTVVLIAPWLIGRSSVGQRIWPSARVLGALILAGLVGQLAGNVLFQWSLGVVGIALTTPLTLGTIILAGAVLGRVFLGEPVTRQTAASILVLLAAISVLSWGAKDAHQSVAAAQKAASSATSVGLVAAGVGAACLAGLSYAVLTVVIRYGVTGRTSISTTLFTVGLVGVISLGGLSHARMGLAGILSTDFDDLAMMLLAGVCNAAAFLALTKALQLTTIVYVNALGATQVALSALAGIALFSEAISGALVSGVVLTAVGLLLMETGRKRRRQVSGVLPAKEDAECGILCSVEVSPPPIAQRSVCETE